MNLPSDPLDLAILLRREMQQSRINEDGNSEGVLPTHMDFQQVLDAIEHCDLRGPSDDSASRKLEFSLPPHYYLSMEMLLRAPARRVEPPSNFYVEDLDYRYSVGADNLPSEISQYLQACRLFHALTQVADDERRLAGMVTLVFLHNQKLEITTEYGKEHLRDLPRLEEFEQQYFISSTHKQQKATILRTALFNIFSGQSKVSLSDILERFSEFVEHVESSYQLYVSEFSFQKVKAEIEKEKLEFTTKLNKVFSDIQNQLLAVPAALILIGGQMENGGTWSIKNLLIWSGAMVFALLMNLLINNQRHTLRAIKLEIDQQWDLIQGKHKTVADQFKDNYRQLDDRYAHQHRLLGTVSALVAAALAFATGMLLWYSVSWLLFLQSVIWGIALGLPAYGLYQLALFWKERIR